MQQYGLDELSTPFAKNWTNFDKFPDHGSETQHWGTACQINLLNFYMFELLTQCPVCVTFVTWQYRREKIPSASKVQSASKEKWAQKFMNKTTASA